MAEQRMPRRGPGSQSAIEAHEKRDREYFEWRKQQETKAKAKLDRLRALRLEHEAAQRAVEPLATEVDERVSPLKKKARK